MVVKNDHKILWITIILLLLGVLIGGACFFYWDKIVELYKYSTETKIKVELEKDKDEIEVLTNINDIDALKSDKYLEFTVKGTSNIATDVSYNIYLGKKDYDDRIKVSLTKITNNNEEEIINNNILYLDTYQELNNSKLLYKTNFTFNTNEYEKETTYRLRAWSNEDIKTNKLSIFVNTKELPNLDDCYITENSYITGYKCYQGNLYNMPTETDLVIKQTINNEKILGIAKNTFYNEEKNEGVGLTSVVIEDNLTIDESAFNNNNLKKVVLPKNINEIKSKTFYNNTIESIILPDSIISIDEEAFANNLLTTLSLSENVKTIKYHAFYNNSLTEVIIYNKNNLEDFQEIDMDAFGFMIGYNVKNIKFINE